MIDPVSFIPKQARTRARLALNRIGLDVTRQPFSYRLQQVLALHRVTTVIDVGAGEGEYGQGLRSAGYIGQLLSLEPLAGSFARLRTRATSDPNWEVMRAAASDSAGPLSINVAGNGVSSSVLPMLPLHEQADPQSSYRAREEVPAVTVDALIAERRIDPARTLLKVDVQGYERVVLNGAASSLGSIAAVQLELSLVPLYGDQPLLDELLHEMFGWELELWSLEPGFSDRRTGRLYQCDGIFVRP